MYYKLKRKQIWKRRNLFTSHGINEGRDNKSQLVLAKQGDYEEKSGKIKREYFFEKYKEYKNGTFNSLEKTRNDFKRSILIG